MVGMMLKSLACLILLCAVGGDVIAYQSPEADATKPESQAAIPAIKENFVLRLTAVRQRAVEDRQVPNPLIPMPASPFEAPGRKSSAVPSDLDPFAEDVLPSTGSTSVRAVARTMTTSTVAQAKVVTATEQMELFCEDVEVSAKVNESGGVAYTLTCKGHVRIKGRNSTIVGKDASFADGVIKLASAEVTTGDAVIKTNEASFEFPLTALQISRVDDQLPGNERIPDNNFFSSEPTPASFDRDPYFPVNLR